MISNLNDILNYIDIGITNNNHKDHYILYISNIHNYFLNLEGVDFGIRYDILRQLNLLITKLINHDNSELRDEWIKLRSLIVPDLIEYDDELDDDDRYFITKSKK